MSWTAPKTWVANTVLAAADLNTHVRDEFLETAPGKATAAAQTVFSTAANAIAMVTLGKYKATDETVNNSTTLQDDNDLFFAIAANEVWAFDVVWYFTIASGNPGVKVLFTFPSGCTGQWGISTPGNNNIDNYVGGGGPAMGSFQIGTTAPLTISSVTSSLMFGQGVIVNGANAGTFQMQWAQNSAVASDLKLKAGSRMNLKRLA